MTEDGTTFDLTTQQGAADAAAYLIGRLGDRLVIECGPDLRHPARVRPTSVDVWRDGDGYALSVTDKGLPTGFHGTIRVSTDAEPPYIPREERALRAMLRRPIRSDTKET